MSLKSVVVAGADLRHVLVRFCFRVFHSLMTTTALAIDHFAHQPAHSPQERAFTQCLKAFNKDPPCKYPYLL